MKRAVGILAFIAVATGACQDQESPVSTSQNEIEPSFFITPQGSQAVFGPGFSGTMKPLVTVDEVMPASGLPLAGTLDGIGAWENAGLLNLYVNHEISGASRVSRFTMTIDPDPANIDVLSHGYVLDGSEGYSRLCSAEWVDTEDGFPGGYFFTGEETDAGLQLIIDGAGTVTELPHIGRYNHENQISVPGFGTRVVALNFDDKGGRGESLSELYMYVAQSSEDFIAGRGALYVFAANNGSAIQNPGQLSLANNVVDGRWLRVPEKIALDPDHTVLQDWAHRRGAFPFVRLEDGFYDKRPGAGPAAFVFDTGRQVVPNSNGTDPWDPWGSVYKIEFLNPNNPAGKTRVLLLARSNGPALGWASPDNGDMNAAGEIMLQEDPANGPWNRNPAIWRLQLQGEALGPAQRVVVLQDPGDPSNEDVFGWESSGIVDASEWYGQGAWIFDVQAHSVDSSVAGDWGQLIFMRLDN